MTSQDGDFRTRAADEVRDDFKRQHGELAHAADELNVRLCYEPSAPIAVVTALRRSQLA
jgi:hypothetical protein